MNLEQLTKEEFDIHIANNTLRLALVGMSNAGKSHRSRVLKDGLDFFWYEVDAAIQKVLGFETMEEISAWLGYPTDATYSERQAQYLAAEEAVTHLADLDTEQKNLVFDTTGSVIYLSGDTKTWLQQDCLVVHVDVGEDSLDEMVETYFDNPRPVVWGDSFSPGESEDADTTLRRCYPELLNYRLAEYRKFAHVTVPLKELYDVSGEETLAVIRKYL